MSHSFVVLPRSFFSIPAFFTPIGKVGLIPASGMKHSHKIKQILSLFLFHMPSILLNLICHFTCIFFNFAFIFGFMSLYEVAITRTPYLLPLALPSKKSCLPYLYLYSSFLHQQLLIYIPPVCETLILLVYATSIDNHNDLKRFHRAVHDKHTLDFQNQYICFIKCFVNGLIFS